MTTFPNSSFPMTMSLKYFLTEVMQYYLVHHVKRKQLPALVFFFKQVWLHFFVRSVEVLGMPPLLGSRYN